MLGTLLRSGLTPVLLVSRQHVVVLDLASASGFEEPLRSQRESNPYPQIENLVA